MLVLHVTSLIAPHVRSCAAGRPCRGPWVKSAAAEVAVRQEDVLEALAAVLRTPLLRARATRRADVLKKQEIIIIQIIIIIIVIIIVVIIIIIIIITSLTTIILIIQIHKD